MGATRAERVADGRGDRPRIVRIEQAARIAGIVDGVLLAATRDVGAQEADALRAVEHVGAAGLEARLVHRLQQAGEPGFVERPARTSSAANSSSAIWLGLTSTA